jgi:hypothetical protein
MIYGKDHHDETTAKNNYASRLPKRENRRPNLNKMSQPGATQPCLARVSSNWNLETNFTILEIL